MDDDDFDSLDLPEEEVEEIVPPTPWHNSDTVAASFLFAANIAASAAEHFRLLSMLALGQSAHEWFERDKQEFIEDSLATIDNLPEGGESSE